MSKYGFYKPRQKQDALRLEFKTERSTDSFLLNDRWAMPIHYLTLLTRETLSPELGRPHNYLQTGLNGKLNATDRSKLSMIHFQWIAGWSI
jgi:hypothetical protein